MKNVLFLALLFVGFTLNGQIETPAPSPGSTITQTVGLTDVEVVYSRPAVKERDIFSADGLVPFNKVWRTGANQATKVTFSTDVTINGEKLDGGSYAILSIPSASSWKVHFYTYESSSFSSYVEKDPNLVVTAKSMRLNDSVESFTIGFENLKDTGADMTFAWSKTKAMLNVGVDSDGTVMASIDRVLAGPSQGDYYNAASYYHTAGKDLNKALEWVEKATAGDNPRFWQVRRKALILADLGKKKEAIAAAKMSLDLAKAAGNQDYVRLNENSLKEWGM